MEAAENSASAFVKRDRNIYCPMVMGRLLSIDPDRDCREAPRKPFTEPRPAVMPKKTRFSPYRRTVMKIQ